MIQLDLTDAERALLIDVLEIALSELRMEIAGTDSMDFREMLKGRKAAVRKALDGLKGG